MHDRHRAAVTRRVKRAAPLSELNYWTGKLAGIRPSLPVTMSLPARACNIISKSALVSRSSCRSWAIDESLT
jgi:hypothetical protein